MITEQFLNSCFYLLLNESMGVKKDKTLYRDIYEVIQFYKDKETLELSTLMKPKFDCLDRICELGLESREISNILDSILGGGEIVLNMAQTSKEIILEIQDTGSGIRAEDKKFIFDPFFSKRHRALGLGLTFAKRIINGHKGEISARTFPGKGTEIIIKLPSG